MMWASHFKSTVESTRDIFPLLQGRLFRRHCTTTPLHPMKIRAPLNGYFMECKFQICMIIDLKYLTSMPMTKNAIKGLRLYWKQKLPCCVTFPLTVRSGLHSGNIRLATIQSEVVLCGV